ncbi:MAG: biotin/lipoate A/B protein ligase family protein [Acidobacteria bacterium]|nr:biotin/lipoate A/B protein ligase family protein [Acidobacteriota bacterium]
MQRSQDAVGRHPGATGHTTSGKHPGDWRLVLDCERPGALNMALDEVLTRACAAGEGPVLRLYGWSRPTLSLGRNQELARAADLEACEHLGVDVVRRPSGGHAVLHEREITYALSVPASEPLLASGARAALRRIADAIALGLGRLGVRARRQVCGRGRDVPGTAVPVAPCFATTARDEVTVDGIKVAAAAQWRLRRALLQQGSIPLSIDSGRLMRVTGAVAGRGMPPVGAGAGILRWLSWDERQPAHRADALIRVRRRLIESLIGGFEETLGVRLRPDRLRGDELAAARELQSHVYGSTTWTRRR